MLYLNHTVHAYIKMYLALHKLQSFCYLILISHNKYFFLLYLFIYFIYTLFKEVYTFIIRFLFTVVSWLPVPLV